MTTSPVSDSRRSARQIPPGKISVMLHRGAARPRGCYVSDYNDHGVLLKCAAQGPPETSSVLRVGDRAQIHFWDRAEAGRSDRVSGRIVRLDDDEVAIEYTPTSTTSVHRFLNLLQQRVDNNPSEESPMKEPRMPKIRLPGKNDTMEADTSRLSEQGPLKPGRQAAAQAPVVTGGAWVLGLLAAAILGVLALGLYSVHLNSRLEDLVQSVAALETRDSGQDMSSLVADVVQRMSDIEQRQREINASLSDAARQEDLQAAVIQLSTDIQALRQPAKVSGQGATAARKSTAASPPAATVGAQTTAAVPAAAQLWTIHLVTLSDATAADNFIDKAKAMQIDVGKEQMMVNGKQVYRLSISGLSSNEAAEQLAAEVQQRLALTRKPWIEKRTSGQ